MFQIGDEAARRRQSCTRKAAEAVERRHAEQRFQPRLRLAAVEAAARPQAGRRVCVVAAFGGHHLGGAQSRQFRTQRVGRTVDDHEPPGRHVRRRQRHRAGRLADGDAPIVATRIEQRFLGQRAGSDDPHDRAVDQRLAAAGLAGGLGAFGLFGDGDAVARLDQALEVGGRGMDGHAAHRHLLAVMLAAGGKGDVEHLARHPRIVEEQFEEVAHTVEQQAILRLRLQAEVLRHHRGRGGHDSSVGIGLACAMPDGEDRDQIALYVVAENIGWNVRHLALTATRGTPTMGEVGKAFAKVEQPRTDPVRRLWIELLDIGDRIVQICKRRWVPDDLSHSGR